MDRGHIHGEEREAAADERDRIADKRDRSADEREAAADERDRIADKRDRSADEREAAADERDRVADDRERLAEVKQPVTEEHEVLARDGELLLGEGNAVRESVHERMVSVRIAAAERAEALAEQAEFYALYLKGSADRGDREDRLKIAAWECEVAAVERRNAAKLRDLGTEQFALEGVPKRPAPDEGSPESPAQPAE
jgi:hypothetical protein